MGFVNQQAKVSIVINRDFFQSVELLVQFIKCDLRVKYKHPLLGIFWVPVQPLIFGALFLFITKYFSPAIPTNHINYFSMFAVLIPWQLFTGALQGSVNCISSNYGVVSRIKIPILFLPLTVITTSLIYALVNVFIYFLSMVISGKLILINVFYLLLVLLISSVFIFSVCVFFALLQCFIRETKHVAAFIIKASLFILPILYSENIVPENIRALYHYFPIVWMVSVTKKIVAPNFVFPFCDSLMILLIGLVSVSFVYLIYKKVKNHVVDYI